MARKTNEPAEAPALEEQIAQEQPAEAPKPIKPPCVCASCKQQQAVLPSQIIR